MANTKVTGELIADNAIKAVHIDETATGITLADLSVTGGLTVDTNTLVVDAANNQVGIGTSSVTSGVKLQVQSSGGTILQIKDTTSGAGDYSNIWFGDESLDYAGFLGYNHESDAMTFGTTGSERMRIDSSGNVTLRDGKKLILNRPDNAIDCELSTNASGTLILNSRNGEGFDFQNAGTGAMRIDSSGNVGIGVSPSFKLQTYNSSDGTTAAFGGTIYGLRIDSGGTFSSDGTTIFGVDDTFTASYQPLSLSASYLRFNTGTNEEAMRITSGGNVLIGTQTENISARLFNVKASGKVAGSFYRVTTDSTDGVFEIISDFGSSNRVVLNIAADGDVTNINNSYGAISDAKLKENIVDASPKLDDLLQVKIRNFNYIGDDKKQLGVVAQELEEVFPSMIDESPDFEEQEVIDEEGNVTTEKVDLGTTTKSVKYSVFVPMLIKAMQEQQEIINDLKARIETLEAK